MRILRLGALYYALTFGAGFVLGVIRVLWIVPAVGERAAELLEAPLMLAVIVVAARWIGRRFGYPPTASGRLAVGGIALALLLATEFTVVLTLRGMTLAEYFASRDPVAGSVYAILLILFAVMPLLAVRRPAPSAGPSPD